MITSNQVVPGMIISLDEEVFRVESCVRVTVSKGVPFIKTKLRHMVTDDEVEKNFQIDQEVLEVKLEEKKIEYLYAEGHKHIFLDVLTLEQVTVAQEIIGDKVTFLKEGTMLNALFYGNVIYSSELPQFLELMVSRTEDMDPSLAMSASNRIGILETGARIELPMFIEAGDVIKVDTSNREYVQRI